VGRLRQGLVIDADGHICEPPVVWEKYAEPRYRDDVLQIRRQGRPFGELFHEGRFLQARPGLANPARACIPGAMRPEVEVSWDDILPGSYDPAARLEVMEAEGIDRALLFPSIYLLFGDIRDPSVAAATCRAYNEWIADFCRHDPARLFAMGIVPLQDVELAVAEARRLAPLGLRGIAIRPERFNGLALYDERCDSLWEVAVGDHLAIGIHGSFGTRMPGFATERYADNVFFEHMVAHPFGQMAALMDLVAGGVLDRFPRLRVGFFESGLAWLPYWLDRLDEHFEVMGHFAPRLRRRPSEIFRESCFVSMEARERRGLEWMVERDLAGCVLWGSDYPHFDTTYPGAVEAARATFEAVGPELVARVVDANPRRFLGGD
jgi:predicted TIM-barrel fold metal-dependent hydrolase